MEFKLHAAPSGSSYQLSGQLIDPFRCYLLFQGRVEVQWLKEGILKAKHAQIRGKCHLEGQCTTSRNRCYGELCRWWAFNFSPSEDGVFAVLSHSMGPFILSWNIENTESVNNCFNHSGLPRCWGCTEASSSLLHLEWLANNTIDKTFIYQVDRPVTGSSDSHQLSADIFFFYSLGPANPRCTFMGPEERTVFEGYWAKTFEWLQPQRLHLSY